MWIIFLLLFVAIHLVCMLVGLICLLTTELKYVTTYLIVAPLLSLAFSMQSLRFVYLFDEAVSIGLLALPFLTCGVFLGIYLAFKVSTAFNELIRFRTVSEELFSKIYTRTLLSVVATFNAFGILLFTVLSWQIVGLSEKLNEQTVSLSHGSRYCILDVSFKPVSSFNDINYWKVTTEAIAYNLGLPNSVELSGGWGDGSWRGIHFAIVLPDKYYYWSFWKQKFIEVGGVSRLTQICDNARTWRN